MYQVDYSRQPALFNYSFVSLGTTPLTRYTGIAARLLDTLSYQNTEDFENTFEIFRGRNSSLVSEDASGNLAGNGAASWICLCVKEREIMWKGESSEQ